MHMAMALGMAYDGIVTWDDRYEWERLYVFVHDYNHGKTYAGRHAILKNTQKNDNNYDIEMAIVTCNECINYHIVR